MDTFDAVLTWMEDHAPGYHETLRRPATARAIAKAEETLGRPLPPALLEMYHRHDGQEMRAHGMFVAWQWMPLKELTRNWQMMVELDEVGDLGEQTDPTPGVQEVRWHRAWTPFLHDFGGNLIVMDMAPGPGGTPGQILSWDHEVAHIGIDAVSLDAWLARFFGELERGEHVPREDGFLAWGS